MKNKVNPIIGRAFKRLNKALNIDLEIPEVIPLEETDFDFDSLNFKYETKTQNKTNYRTIKVRPWYYLWMIQIEQTVEFTQVENRFIVSLENILDAADIALEKRVQISLQEINKYVDGDFKDLVDKVFAEVDTLLRESKETLERSIKDQNTSLVNQEQIKHSLEIFSQDSKRCLNKIKKYLEFKEQL